MFGILIQVSQKFVLNDSIDNISLDKGLTPSITKPVSNVDQDIRRHMVSLGHYDLIAGKCLIWTQRVNIRTLTYWSSKTTEI